MRKYLRSKFNVFTFSLIFSGCAGFEPGLRFQDLTRPRQPTVKEIQEGLEVSVEEFASAYKSNQAFDSDIAPNGVLALLIRVENNGTETFRVQQNNIRAFLGAQPLSSLPGEEAANRGAAREYFGKALFWAILPGPFNIIFGIPGIAAFTASASHTHSVNRRIQQHLENLGFTDAVLRPNQTAVGFLYFQLPDGVQRLEKLTAEVGASEDRSGKQISYKLSLPTVELSAPVTFRQIPPGDEK